MSALEKCCNFFRTLFPRKVLIQKGPANSVGDFGLRGLKHSPQVIKGKTLCNLRARASVALGRALDRGSTSYFQAMTYKHARTSARIIQASRETSLPVPLGNCR